MEIRRTTAMGAMALLLGATACGGQGTELKDLVNPTAGDGGVIAADGNAPHTAYTDPFAGAPAYAAPKPGDTAHNAGQACGQASCHGPGGGGPPFLIGGTVYKDYAGKSVAVGVEVRIVDTSNHAASTYSDSAGNFYIKSGATNVAFPAVVGVRDGTNQRPMITQLTNGSCAAGGCHAANGYGPIHIP